MAMKFKQTFEVTGTMQFPIDMLRYDEAFPATEQDSGQIIRATYGSHESWRIKLARYTETARDLPNFMRWQSFCALVDTETVETRRLA